MVPHAPYFQNRGISDSLGLGGKRVIELVAFGVARGTTQAALRTEKLFDFLRKGYQQRLGGPSCGKG
jgi:hypothetical protein